MVTCSREAVLSVYFCLPSLFGEELYKHFAPVRILMLDIITIHVVHKVFQINMFKAIWGQHLKGTIFFPMGKFFPLKLE